MLLFWLMAAILSFLLTGAATYYARRRGLLDHPGERHSHSVPTPRGGGAGWVLAFFISLGLEALYLGEFFPAFAGLGAFLAGTAVLAGLGAWDDHRDLSARLRFAVQLAVSVVLLASFANAGWTSGWMAGVLGVVFTLWMINLYNFMDGSNGMAACQGVFVFAVMAWLFSRSGDPAGLNLSLLLAACCAGFLPWNLGRAKVFMGDVGSLALGFSVAGLLVYGTGSGAFSLPVALMVSALFLADATLTLLVRVFRGERWYNAHRQHLYQRIIALGRTHGHVLLVYQVINLALVLPGIVIGVAFPALAWPVALLLAVLLATGWYLSTKRIGELAAAR
jgi:Fuc2NAc and GlcNAc transferase